LQIIILSYNVLNTIYFDLPNPYNRGDKMSLVLNCSRIMRRKDGVIEYKADNDFPSNKRQHSSSKASSVFINLLTSTLSIAIPHYDVGSQFLQVRSCLIEVTELEKERLSNRSHVESLSSKPSNCTQDRSPTRQRTPAQFRYMRRRPLCSTTRSMERICLV